MTDWCVWQGITFADFKEFCQFLNSLDDFALAMRIYTYASQPISEGTIILKLSSSLLKHGSRMTKRDTVNKNK